MGVITRVSTRELVMGRIRARTPSSAAIAGVTSLRVFPSLISFERKR